MSNDTSLLQQTAAIVTDYLAQNHHPDQPISEYRSAADLSELLALQLDEEGCDDATILQDIRDYLQHSVRTSHPHFMKQLYAGCTPAAIAGDWIATVTNTAAHTYQVAPVATLMEQYLIDKLNQLIGFDDGDGIMVSGGSNANMLGIHCALHQRWPQIKQQGFGGLQPVLYVSEQCHYSYEKGVFTLGIGTDNLRKVSCDERFRMKPEALRAQIESDISNGKQPFFIGATSGTTVAGAFDPIDELADIAKEFGLWLHVDAAWGAPVLFSDQYKSLMQGVERADSLTWDAHKFMSLPLICSAVLLREKGILESACSGGGGAYLFHQDENSDYNFGQKSLQCGRHVDALKFWLGWRSQGSSGFRKQLEKAMQQIQYCRQKVLDSERLELLVEPDFLNLFFRYVPATETAIETIESLNREILSEMKKAGTFYVDQSTLNGQFGIRLVISNEQTQNSHLDTLFSEILRLGDELKQRTIFIT